MRILMVTSFYPPHHFGGDGTYVRQLFSALQRRGHDVDVVYCHDAYAASGGRIPATEADKNPNIHCLKSPFGFLSPLYSHTTGRPGPKSADLKRLTRKPYDVIHFHNISLMGGPKILSMPGAPIKVFTAHEHWSVCPTHIFWKNGNKACDSKTCFSCQIRSGRPPQMWRYSNLLQESFNQIDLIFTPSEFTRDALRDGGLHRPMSVLPLFAPDGFDQLCAAPASPERLTFLFAGRVTASKGIDRLADLFVSRPHLDLDIVGDGDMLPRLQKAHASTPNIRFLGSVPQADLKRMYRAAHALVLPSLAPETFGLVILEAFSQNTPAIVRDAGGAAEAVRASGAGIVFQTDVEAGHAIDLLAADLGLRAKLGGLARKYFLEFGTEDQHVSAYLAKLAELGQTVGEAQTP